MPLRADLKSSQGNKLNPCCHGYQVYQHVSMATNDKIAKNAPPSEKELNSVSLPEYITQR